MPFQLVSRVFRNRCLHWNRSSLLSEVSYRPLPPSPITMLTWIRWRRNATSERLLCSRLHSRLFDSTLRWGKGGTCRLQNQNSYERFQCRRRNECFNESRIGSINVSIQVKLILLTRTSTCCVNMKPTKTFKGLDTHVLWQICLCVYLFNESTSTVWASSSTLCLSLLGVQVVQHGSSHVPLWSTPTHAITYRRHAGDFLEDVHNSYVLAYKTL